MFGNWCVRNGCPNYTLCPNVRRPYFRTGPCPKGFGFGHYESRAADLDWGDSEVGERCFVQFGLEVALRGPHVLPIYAKGRQVELASTARFPDAVTLLSNDVFQSSSGAARAVERGAMLRTGRLKQRPARDAPVCSYCLSQRNDPTLSSIPCCSLIYACTFSGDAMKKHTATPRASQATITEAFRSVCTLF